MATVYTDVDLYKFVANHLEAEADASVVVVPVDDREDVGSVFLGADGNVVKFAKKERVPFAPHLNAGT
jgi:NDP-sugar pyrophosphorylase family protein